MGSKSGIIKDCDDAIDFKEARDLRGVEGRSVALAICGDCGGVGKNIPRSGLDAPYARGGVLTSSPVVIGLSHVGLDRGVLGFFSARGFGKVKVGITIFSSSSTLAILNGELLCGCRLMMLSSDVDVEDDDSR